VKGVGTEVASNASPSLLELLERAASAPVAVRFLPDGTVVSLGELWTMAGQSAQWMHQRIDRQRPVAMVLDSSPSALAALFGAWRAGRRVVSLPTPPRGSPLITYLEFIETACERAGARHLLVATDHARGFPDLKVTVASFEALGAKALPGRFDERPEVAELAQFTSGSTAEPKAVLLGMRELGANVEAILHVVDPSRGDRACSWLPLSHDMGLVGMVLSALVGLGTGYAGGGELVLIRPEHFLRRPGSWLGSCSDHRATITAAPDFGFLHATRKPAPGLDLRCIRVCITGAEPVRVETLETFTETFADAGFDDRAFCPAYGLAEAGLAVTMTAPSDRWRSLVLRDDHGVERTVVSAGRPLRGYEVAVDASGPDAVDPGPVRISGPSLLRQYLPGEPRSSGWFQTNDLGIVRDGELYITGRADDVVILGGRNVHLADVEHAVARACGMRPAKVQATTTESGYAVVVEAPGGGPHEDLLRDVRTAAVRSTGWQPDFLIATAQGELPRTPSGKPRRQDLRARLESGELAEIHRVGGRSIA
jgi:acyl-CoA synthetase (AMP-forming)/AMP-acid ligase II